MGGTSKNLVLSQNAVLDSGAAWKAINTDSVNYLEMFGGNFNFQVAGSTTAGTTPTWIQSLYLKNDGNVGIGTTSPSTGIEIGNGGETGVSGGGDAGITFINKFDNPDNSFSILPIITGVSNTGLSIRDNTDSADRLVIDGSGNIGINNTAPDVRLEIGNNDSEVEVLSVRYSTVPAYISSGFDGSNALSTFSTNQWNTSDGSASWGAMENTGYSSSAVQLVSNTVGSEIRMFTAAAPNTDPSEKMRITSAGDVNINNDLNLDGADSGIYGKNYAQTSTDSTTSIVDTGIVPVYGAIYEVYVVGNMNGGGSSAYRSVISGHLYLATDYNAGVVNDISWQTIGGEGGGSGDTDITVTPKLLHSGTEYTQLPIADMGTAQIRLRITPYNASYVGESQQVRITRRI